MGPNQPNPYLDLLIFPQINEILCKIFYSRIGWCILDSDLDISLHIEYMPEYYKIINGEL